ncbi:MAG: hypothetical protein R3C10_05905 [Pirellulales bacterium]
MHDAKSRPVGVRRNLTSVPLLASLAAVLACGLACSPLVAQEPPRPGSNEDRAVRSMNADGNVSDAALYRDYYRYYAYQIAAINQQVEGRTKTVDNGERSARRFINGLRDTKPGSAARKALQGYILEWMPQMASGSYAEFDDVAPHGRVMAMMVVAQINETDSPVKPSPDAVPVLLEAIDGKQYDFDGVRAAALYGIVRHAEAGIDDAQAAKVFEKLAALATQTDPPPGRDDRIHSVLRARAVDGLAAMGVTEKVPSATDLAKALSTTLAAESSRGIALRCAAAAAIGQQNWNGKSDVDFKDVGLKLANLAIAVTNAASSTEELQSRLHSVDLAAHRRRRQRGSRHRRSCPGRLERVR